MIEPAEPERRESGYKRMKRMALKAEAALAERTALSNTLGRDLDALETLVERLLNHLQVATDPNITDQDRDRYRRMANDIRGHLATKE